MMKSGNSIGAALALLSIALIGRSAHAAPEERSYVLNGRSVTLVRVGGLWINRECAVSGQNQCEAQRAIQRASDSSIKKRDEVGGANPTALLCQAVSGTPVTGKNRYNMEDGLCIFSDGSVALSVSLFYAAKRFHSGTPVDVRPAPRSDVPPGGQSPDASSIRTFLECRSLISSKLNVSSGAPRGTPANFWVFHPESSEWVIVSGNSQQYYRMNGNVGLKVIQMTAGKGGSNSTPCLSGQGVRLGLIPDQSAGSASPKRKLGAAPSFRRQPADVGKNARRDELQPVSTCRKGELLLLRDDAKRS